MLAGFFFNAPLNHGNGVLMVCDSGHRRNIFFGPAVCQRQMYYMLFFIALLQV